MEVSAGVADDEAAEGVTADAGVRVSGIAVTIDCGEANGADEGEGRPFLITPLAMAGKLIAEGAMIS